MDPVQNLRKYISQELDVHRLELMLLDASMLLPGSVSPKNVMMSVDNIVTQIIEGETGLDTKIMNRIGTYFRFLKLENDFEHEEWATAFRNAFTEKVEELVWKAARNILLNYGLLPP